MSLFSAGHIGVRVPVGPTGARILTDSPRFFIHRIVSCVLRDRRGAAITVTPDTLSHFPDRSPAGKAAMVVHLSAHAAPSPTPARGLGRRRTPYVTSVVVALGLGGIVWCVALRGSDAATQAVACPVPPVAEAAGLEEQSADVLDTVEPAALNDTR